jgi:coenzyme F420-reducing hydrogenase delta subunit/NAD-dependent dihydropyrimidine dehydrogenase PreA subunit
MEAIRQAAENVDAGGKSIVVFRHAPVAHLFGEELYESAKRSGVQFYRFGDALPLAVRQKPTGKYQVTVSDLIEAGDAVVLECDRLLAATGLDVSSLIDHAAEMPGIETDSEGFLISESIHCHSGRSFKNGIFSVGDATGNLEFMGTVAEAASAAVRARAWMVQAAQSQDQLTLDVTEQCCRCLTCHRMCPHDAVTFCERATRFHVHASLPACQKCGLCVAECPRLALDLLDFPDERFADFLAQVRDRRDSKSVVVYGCERSAGRIVNNVLLPEQVHFLSVPCAGRTSESVLWATLQAGAAGALVVGCHHGNCASDTGTDGAAIRVAGVIEKLDVPGTITSRLRYVTVAPNERARFGRILDEFCSLLQEFC